MRILRLLSLPVTVFWLFTSSGGAAMGASAEALTLAEKAERSDAIGRGMIESLTAYRGSDGFIRTKAVFRIDEIYKGQFPERLAFHYRGGTLENEGESVFGAPAWKAGEDRLLFLSFRADGDIALVGGPAGAPSACGEPLAQLRVLQPDAAPGGDLRGFDAGEERPVAMLEPPVHPAASAESPEGLFAPPRRFVISDRGKPIPYLVDADSLPPGITLAQALEALDNALAAWVDVSSARFAFEGIESFGMAANNVLEPDGRLRIQLHDSYGEIPGPAILGIGGQGYSWIDLFSDGGTGGRVGEFEFHRTNRGYVVINHTASSVQNLQTFEAVLCHEIGHALGLAHSSDDPDETDPYVREAMMYYRIHTDGRGATLGEWDEAVIATAHPAGTPPPFGFDRVLRAVTAPAPLANPEVNEIALRGYSLHGANTAGHLYFSTSNNGSFALSGQTLGYSPSGAFQDSQELDPGGGQFFDRVYARFDDGINLSPPVLIRVIQFLLDTRPAGAPDGLPDSWMEEHFGSISPVAGVSGAHDDPDGDGQTNIEEFLLGTDPLDPDSRFAITNIGTDAIAFSARPFEVYELQMSDDLVLWEPVGQIRRPDASVGAFPLPIEENPRRFYRVVRVP